MPASYHATHQEWLWKAFKSGAAMPLSSRPARRPAARAAKPDLKAALEDIRRELLEARDLLAALGRPQKES